MKRQAIYHRVNGQKMIVYAANGWDIRVVRLSNADGYKLTRWYNPYRTRLGGLFCGSITVETQHEVERIINRFANGITIEELPDRFPSFAIRPTENGIDTNRYELGAKESLLNNSLNKSLKTLFNRFLSVVHHRRSSARIFR
ncbi:hypothetical protein NSTC745_03868 [Nostoc sp. DSM 114161]